MTTIKIINVLLFWVNVLENMHLYLGKKSEVGYWRWWWQVVIRMAPRDLVSTVILFIFFSETISTVVEVRHHQKEMGGVFWTATGERAKQRGAVFCTGLVGLGSSENGSSSSSCEGVSSLRKLNPLL
jgi:hypothetical protein